jgi:hypothetical protein
MSYLFDAANERMVGSFTTLLAFPITMVCAVKTNPHPALTATLVALGINGSSNSGSINSRISSIDDGYAAAPISDAGTANSVTASPYNYDGAFVRVLVEFISSTERRVYVGAIGNVEGGSGLTANSITQTLRFIQLGESLSGGNDLGLVTGGGLLAEVAIWNAQLTTQQKTDALAGLVSTSIQPTLLRGYWPLSASNSTQQNLGVDATGDLAVTGATFSTDHPTVTGSAVEATVTPNPAYMTTEGSGDIETYAAITGHTSSVWGVTVAQGNNARTASVRYMSNVYWNLIDGSNTGLTRENHWVQISSDFVGGPITVVVTRLTGSITEGTVMFQDTLISSSVNTTAKTVTFTITEAGQYYIRTIAEGTREDYPLFLFVDPIDTDIPVAGANVVFYDPGGNGLSGTYITSAGAIAYVFNDGVHNVDPDYSDAAVTPVATAFEVDFGQEVYIKGGAWVNGKIHGGGGTGVLKIRGPGTLSGEQYLALADVAGGNEIAINIDNNTDGSSTVECSGITVTEAARKNFICNDPGFLIDYMKFIGITGDGPTMEDNSIMQNSFTKLNDDHSKFFDDNAQVLNHSCWLNKAGPGSHVSWQVTGNHGGNLVDGMWVFHNDRALLGSSAGIYSQFISNSIVQCTNMGNGGPSGTAGHITNNTYRNVYAHCKVWSPIALWTKWDLAGFDEGLGDLDGFTFENWTIPIAPSATASVGATFWHFNGNGTQTGRITNMAFNDVYIGGVKLTSANRATYMRWSGLDDQATFTYS